MRTIFTTCCVAAVCAVLAMPALGQPAYRILNSYTLGGDGGWDYLNLDPATGNLFVTRGSHVMVIDPANGKQLADITGLQGIHGTDFIGDRAYVSEGGANRIAVIDTKTNERKQWVALPGIAYGTAPTPDGRFLVAALLSVNKVGVIDLRSMQLAHTIDVPKAPQEVLVRPDGAVAYVSCDQSRQIAVIDLKEFKVQRLIEAGPLADGLAWAPSSR